jgi:hypothetical protein
MKTSKLPALPLGILVFAASCHNAGDRNAYRTSDLSEAPTADSAMVSAPAPSNMSGEKLIPLNDESRKIIKTADLRCRVTDVLSATTHVELLAQSTGGQISDSRLENNAEEVRSLPYKPDSLRQVESYTTTAHLTLRIPVSRLDTVLSDIAANAAFINNRSLHLDDVTLRYLSNKLKNEAMATNGADQHALTLARRSKDAVFSGEYTDERNETRIDRRIENMQLTDQVTYATLTLDLYQPQRISATIIPNIEYLMKPTLAQQIGIALNNGWLLLRAIFIGLLQIWPLLLLLIAGLIFYRARRAKRGVREAIVRA